MTEPMEPPMEPPGEPAQAARLRAVIVAATPRLLALDDAASAHRPAPGAAPGAATG